MSFTMLQEFGERVRRSRQKRSMTQQALGDSCGIDRTYVGSLERGERNVALINIVRIAAVLGEDPATFISGLRPDPEHYEKRPPRDPAERE